MHVESFIGNLGLWLGTLVRFIVETLNGLFGTITEAGSNFVDGMARALGMDTSIISIAVLIIGLLFLYNAVRAFMRDIPELNRIVAGVRNGLDPL